MFEYQVAIVVIATFIGFLSFVPYFRDIFKGTTKPHIFTWFIWGVLVSVAFFVQLSEGAGLGAWITGLEAIGCFTVAVFAFTRGEKNITRVDWLSFVGALIAIILWQVADSPLAVLLFVMLADFLGYVPTFRKSYWKPQEETVSQYSLSGTRWILSVVALQTLVLTTWLYPVFLFVLDFSLVALLLIRRRQLNVKAGDV